MKKIYIIDAGGLSFETYAGVIPTSGRLNHTFSEKIKNYFETKGWEVNWTKIKNEYNIIEETIKLETADLVIYQFPLWWFSVPGQLKVFIDSIFGFGKIWESDGRHHDDPDHNYGLGGLMNNKPYAFSVTLNAPKNAFIGKGEFLQDDEYGNRLFWPLDVANRFIGMKKIHHNFLAYDVVKNPVVEQDFKRFDIWLEELYNNVK